MLRPALGFVETFSDDGDSSGIADFVRRHKTSVYAVAAALFALALLKGLRS